MKRSFIAVACSALSFGGVGCRESTQDLSATIDFGIDVDVTSDPGKGTPSAEIVARGRSIATTDGAGHVSLQLGGAEGDVVELSVKCPAGFESPSQPMSVAIHRLSTASRRPHFDARCAPQRRTVVVGVRADRGPNLPVMHLGREVARTDESGAALVALTVKPGEHVSLMLDTKTDATKGPKLLPESPTLTFVAQDRDDFVTLDQRFDVEKVVPKSAPRSKRAGPTRI